MEKWKDGKLETSQRIKNIDVFLINGESSGKVKEMRKERIKELRDRWKEATNLTSARKDFKLKERSPGCQLLLQFVVILGLCAIEPGS